MHIAGLRYWEIVASWEPVKKLAVICFFSFSGLLQNSFKPLTDFFSVLVFMTHD